MAKTLELRPLPFIVAAYVLGPIAGLAVDGFIRFAWEMHLAFGFVLNQLAGSANVIPILLPVGLAIEFVVATPILLGFARYRWRWLNGVSGVALALVIGATLGLLWVARSNMLTQLWPYSLVVAPVAIASAVCALVIRLVAFRVAAWKPAEPAQVFD